MSRDVGKLRAAGFFLMPGNADHVHPETGRSLGSLDLYQLPLERRRYRIKRSVRAFPGPVTSVF
jgi:hypothetical protein